MLRSEPHAPLDARVPVFLPREVPRVEPHPRRHREPAVPPFDFVPARDMTPYMSRRAPCAIPWKDRGWREVSFDARIRLLTAVPWLISHSTSSLR